MVEFRSIRVDRLTEHYGPVVVIIPNLTLQRS
jgi:hypothetical protein